MFGELLHFSAKYKEYQISDLISKEEEEEDIVSPSTQHMIKTMNTAEKNKNKQTTYVSLRRRKYNKAPIFFFSLSGYKKKKKKWMFMS